MEIQIPLEGGKHKLYSANGLLLLRGYTRVVIGDRGPYIEATLDNINPLNVRIPKNQEWRVKDEEWMDKVFYAEYRSQCDSYVKIYWQMKTVSYADYKIGHFYISPSDLYMDEEGKKPCQERQP